jgi:cation:H+ antiporter
VILLWISFFVCTAAIVYSGTKLARYGDIIAEKTGMGRTWIGLVLMASVTSLPELITGISSVTFAGVPDIAAGDVLGSCVFNMLILSVLDAFWRQCPISSRAHHGHVLSGSIGILLLSIVSISLFAGRDLFPFGWIGPYTLLFGIIYFIAMRLIFAYEKREIAAYMKEVAVELKYKEVAAKTAYIQYGVNALVVIAAAVFLPEIGKGIAEATGLGQTFVGNIFIALSTSLPEVVVSVSAVRMEAIDMAIGNLFGSNIFNIFILGLDDIFFIKGPLLSHVSPSNIISALSAVAMTTIAIIGITYRAEKKYLFLAWDSIAIISVYVSNLMLLYMLR